MHGARWVIACPIAPKEPQLVVGVKAAVARPLSDDVVVARHPPAHLRPVVDHLMDFLRQLGRDPLISVHEKDPFRFHCVHGRVSLTCEVVEGPLLDDRPRLTCQFHRAVIAV